MKKYNSKTAIFTLSLLSVALSGCFSSASKSSSSSVDDKPTTPTITIANTTVNEGNQGATTTVPVKVVLSTALTTDLTIKYVTQTPSTGEVATANTDYTPANNSLTIPAGSTSGQFNLTVIGDNEVEKSEIFLIQYTYQTADGSTNFTGNKASTVLIVDDDKDIVGQNTFYLNDTGVVTCDGNNSAGLDCNSAAAGTDVYSKQDAEHGRDYLAKTGQLVKVGEGVAGFSFTKLDNVGQPVDLSNANWDCVRDNVTGLYWEVKSATSSDLQYFDNTFSWYNTDNTDNGGVAGTPNGGTCTGGISCDTSSYVTEINNKALCGFNDWRVPTREEMRSLINYETLDTSTLDKRFFAAFSPAVHWTSVTFAESPDKADVMGIGAGIDSVAPKTAAHRLFLVRQSAQ